MKKRLSLAITLVLFVFGVLMATFLLVGCSVALLQHFGVISLSASSVREESAGTALFRFFHLVALVGGGILRGAALPALLSNKALNPINQVIAATHRVAQGDFSVQVHLKGIGELEELSQSFNKMTHELASIETLRSDFVNNFSHEFKTPIVSIRGFAKLLRENRLTEEERQEYLDIILTESERLAALATNVLNLTKYESMEIVSEKAPFRLDEQIRRTVVLMQPKWEEKNLTVEAELEETVFTGSEDLTQQIWLNLLDNAVKFSPPGGLIQISLTHTEKDILFRIRDEGAGMDEQTMAHIFDKFYQGDASHSKAGNGLGLTLVKRIVELCGGTIRVESRQGGGSEFIVLLPLLL